MKELRDQVAHFLAATVALFPLVCWPGVLTFTWAGFMLGLVREVTEEGAPVTGPKALRALRSWRDLTFWTLGGTFVGVLHATH